LITVGDPLNLSLRAHSICTIMQVDASRPWPSSSVSDHPVFPLDSPLSSTYRSSLSYPTPSDSHRSSQYTPHRTYSYSSDLSYSSTNHPSLIHVSSTTSSCSSSSSHSHPNPHYDSMQNPPRFPPVHSQSLPSSQSLVRDGRASPPRQLMPPPALYTHPSQIQDSPPSPEARNSSSLHSQFSAMPSMPRLPPILQVEKQQVTTSATQAASASRRRNEAHFMCPVPGCGSTFTRRFNLRGHLRSHTEERPFVCEWPGCGKGFARQHDCKRHQNLHYSKSQQHVCHGCRKTFSRLDALNRHLRSEGGVECRNTQDAVAIADRLSGSPDEDDWEKRTASSVTSSQSPR